jgi:hypothetical protein
MDIKASPKPLKQVLHQRMSLPLYQRPYVWQAAIEKLLDDLFEAFDVEPSYLAQEYFIGNLLLVDNPDNHGEVDLADGQQRLTTLFITLCVLREALRQSDNFRDTAAWLDRTLITMTGPAQHAPAINSPRKQVSAVLTHIALHGCLAETLGSGEAAAVRPYVGALKRIQVWVAENLHSAEAHHRFATYLMDKVFAVVITYPSASMALSVFENINSKGDRLIQSDLLKSAFMKMSGDPTEWPAVDQAWEDIMKNANARTGGVDGFLRKASMAMLFGPIAKASEAPKAQQLLEKITEYCRTKQVSGKIVLEQFNQFSKALGLLESTTPAYLDKTPSELLARLKTHPSRPEFVSTVLCCMPMTLSVGARERIVLAMEAAACVVTLTGSSKNVNYRAQPLCVKLRMLQEEDVTEFIGQVHATLVVPHLAAFKKAFLELRIGAGTSKQKKWAKYLLLIIEAELRRGLGAAALTYAGAADTVVKRGQVEHILPLAILADLGADTVESIGNCALLEPGKNGSVQDAPFVAKKPVYASSDFRVARELAGGAHGINTGERRFLDTAVVRAVWDYPDFDAQAVQRRATGLLEFLISIWELDTVHAEEPKRQALAQPSSSGDPSESAALLASFEPLVVVAERPGAA